MTLSQATYFPRAERALVAAKWFFTIMSDGDITSGYLPLTIIKMLTNESARRSDNSHVKGMVAIGTNCRFCTDMF